jgi:hypothetical protein
LFYVDPANAQAIDQILALAASREIPIFWLLFPLSPDLQSLRDQSGADDEHDRFLKSLVSRHPGTVTVVDMRRAGFPAGFFTDATHLNRRGAVALSRSLAPMVAARERRPGLPSSGPDWIFLSPSVANIDGVDHTLEDIGESKRKVSADFATRVSFR